jgi:hypothetical protein
MPFTRESMTEVMEIVDEVQQWVQEARTAGEEESRMKKLELAEKAMQRIDLLMSGDEIDAHAYPLRD